MVFELQMLNYTPAVNLYSFWQDLVLRTAVSTGKRGLKYNREIKVKKGKHLSSFTPLHISIHVTHPFLVGKHCKWNQELY